MGHTLLASTIRDGSIQFEVDGRGEVVVYIYLHFNAPSTRARKAKVMACYYPRFLQSCREDDVTHVTMS